MDAMERSHTFESAVVSSLFNARQMIWTELSSVISDIKEKFDHSNKERDAELNRLVAENQSLSSILKRFREIAEGKELEINGLRRQLQGFYSGRPICSSCSRPITPIKNACKSSTVSDDDKKGDLGGCSRPHFLGPIEARKRDRLNASLSSNSVEQIQTNPRDIVISWLGTGKNFRGRRPSEKRPCVRASLSSLVRQPIVLVKDTEASESPFDGSVSHSSGQTPTNVARSPERTMDTSTFGLDNLSGSPTENRNNVENVSGVGPEGNLGIAKLSPPSESYDASLAIRNAVNHLDLANYENTLVEFTHSQASQAEYNRVGESSRKNEKLITHGSTTSRFTVRRRFALSMEPFRHHIHHHLGDRNNKNKHHKVTCRHARHSLKKLEEPPKPIVQTQKPPDLDETGADLSLPSDFLVSELSEFPRPGSSDVHQLTGTHPNLSESDKILPSLGGSPTRDASLFKRPKNPVGHTMLKLPSSTEHHQPSVPDQCSQPDSQETQLPEPSARNDGTPPKLQQNHPNVLVGLCDKENQFHSSNEVSGFTEKFTGPVERRKSVRREMPAHACRSCQEYYESTGLTSPEIAVRIQHCSRHRTHHGPPPSTPKGFWDLDISDCEIHGDSQETESKDDKIAHGRSHSLRRRRPFGITNDGKPSVGTV